MDPREWVQDHDDKSWHWYGSGQYAHAACGKPAIAGTPLVHDVPPRYDGAILCEDCEHFWDFKHNCS